MDTSPLPSPSQPRRCCFIISSHIHFARNRLILEEIKKHPNLKLQIAVAASAILPQYGDVLPDLEKAGFTPDATIRMTLAGGCPVAMAKTAGIGVTEFATAFDNLKPDIVIIRGDRYEVLSAAIAASYMNIPVAHIEGGDSTGSIDESVRHAVTKLAHIHFPTNEISKKRILQMGEDPSFVHDVGAPEVEVAARHMAEIVPEEINIHGVGVPIDFTKPYLLVLHHPVTTDMGGNREKTNILLHAIESFGLQTIWFWPNVDAGTDEVAKAIRVFREKEHPEHMHFLKYVPSDAFLALLKNCACLIGNSSAGIKESSFFGTPTINVGNRQEGRLHGANVVDCDYNHNKLVQAVEKQLEQKRYEPSSIYYKEECSKHVADILAMSPLYTQKHFRTQYAPEELDQMESAPSRSEQQSQLRNPSL